MIKCKICQNLRHEKNRYTCVKCSTKTVYGELQEKIIEHCHFFVMTEIEKEKRERKKTLEKIPIDDSLWMIGWKSGLYRKKRKNKRS